MSKPAFLDTGAVAGILNWHPNTIRDHLIPAADWEEGSVKIPSIKLGGRYLIPRWWVDRVIDLSRSKPKQSA